MHHCWALLLVVGAVTAAPTKPTLLSYEQVVASAVATYNRDLGAENAFRLLEAEPQSDWDPSAKTMQALKFSIKETVCRAEENPDPSQCDEKEDGIDRDCTAFYSGDQSPPVIMVQCEDMAQELDRITRSRWRKFWKKTKNFVRQHGASIGLAALRLRGYCNLKMDLFVYMRSGYLGDGKATQFKILGDQAAESQGDEVQDPLDLVDDGFREGHLQPVLHGRSSLAADHSVDLLVDLCCKGIRKRDFCPTQDSTGLLPSGVLTCPATELSSRKASRRSDITGLQLENVPEDRQGHRARGKVLLGPLLPCCQDEEEGEAHEEEVTDRPGLEQGIKEGTTQHPQSPAQAGTMGRWILLTLGFAMAAATLPPAQEELSYEEAVALAVHLYNQEPEVERTFRLLKARPPAEWDPSLQSLQELEFTVRETTCPPSKKLNSDTCDFKDDGVLKECYGTIFSEQGAPVIQNLCETVGKGHIRVRRGFRKMMKKFKKGVKKRLKKLLTGAGSSIAQGPNRRTIA
ncbi:uncharacterized protein LOC143820852 [Paroedura picta]|uniref:uncharacterized protein LOC143820852 n=1 Tax=Paroedura picta TaxID=143630 RepID=UPI0040577EE8